MVGYPPIDLLEWRQYGYANGGEEGAFTLGNVFSLFNPKIQGRATTWTWPLTPGLDLNGAVSHASVQDTPSQVAYLVTQLKTTYANTVNFEEDWKLLTIFIGANNECGACTNSSQSQPEYFESHLIQTLDLIHKEIPRVFVNLVTIFNISGVYYAGKNYTYCELVWELVPHECGCVETGKKSDLDWMDLRSVQYNAIQEKQAARYAGMNDPNFTVVVQPGLSGMQIAKFGEAYLSALDCFHPSLCANQAFTYMIWNNMYQPVGKKSTTPDVNNLKIHCPTPTDVLQ